MTSVTPPLGLTTTYAVTVKNFAQPTSNDFATLSAMGIRTVRLDLGDSDWQISAESAVIDAYRAQGVQVIGIAPYVQKGTVFSDKVIAQDSAWVGELAPKLYALELQNEPNLSSQEQLTPANYALLAQAVARSARHNNPTIIISSGGTARYDTRWLAQTVPALASSINCIGVHPYGSNPANFARIAADVYNTYQKPMCQTEWGASEAQTAARIHQAAEILKGYVPIFVFFTLAELEENPSYQAAYSNL
ncbi:MAG: glycosyl hydrolase [Vulcanimicrobiaceae bacterium]